MSVRTITNSYEQSSEGGRERHLPIPWSALEDATPTKGDPCCVPGTPGKEIVGTVVVPGSASDPVAIVNVAKGAVYCHNVRNVLTYSQAAEATWGAVGFGDAVYYDPTADTLTSGVCKLSTSPLDGTGAANTLFGHIVLMQDEEASDLPRGGSSAGLSDSYAVQQA